MARQDCTTCPLAAPCRAKETGCPAGQTGPILPPCSPCPPSPSGPVAGKAPAGPLDPEREGNAELNLVYADRDRLPALLRPVMDAQTALPHLARPIPGFDPVRAALRDLGLAAGFGLLAAGGAMVAASGGAGLLALPLAAYGALGVTGRLRRASVGHVHEATHGVIVKALKARGTPAQGAQRISDRIMDLASALSLTRNGIDYGRDHRRHHDERWLGTLEDPDGADLAADGFWRGRFATRRAFWGKLALTLVDPRWHARKIGQRLASNLATGTPGRRLLGLAALAGVAGSALLLPLPAWLAAVGLPWTVLLNAASLMQVLTKHPYGYAAGADTLAAYVERTHERIPWRSMPAAGLSLREALRPGSAGRRACCWSRCRRGWRCSTRRWSAMAGITRPGDGPAVQRLDQHHGADGGGPGGKPDRPRRLVAGPPRLPRRPLPAGRLHERDRRPAAAGRLRVTRAGDAWLKRQRPPELPPAGASRLRNRLRLSRGRSSRGGRRCSPRSHIATCPCRSPTA
ncbi:fatty acid desaturase [Methylobrevis pamukkalensis]|uniref:Uncharacterized protein n=1 Tax=Methylobrevis pamukkalensis TaxID=1439726 RepID=A0A1E3H3D4_9HYPH|nr:fatty acid desaturase [Methylobrevis pamukkalensis]ODN70794.1 hypothetical protein A6302_01898 [Methylobrevis pamukkalensis]